MTVDLLVADAAQRSRLANAQKAIHSAIAEMGVARLYTSSDEEERVVGRVRAQLLDCEDKLGLLVVAHNNGRRDVTDEAPE